MDETKFFTVAQAATKLNKSRPTIYQWLDAGRFPNSFEVGERAKTTLIPLSDMDSVAQEEASKLIDELSRLGFRCEVMPA